MIYQLLISRIYGAVCCPVLLCSLLLRLKSAGIYRNNWQSRKDGWIYFYLTRFLASCLWPLGKDRVAVCPSDMAKNGKHITHQLVKKMKPKICRIHLPQVLLAANVVINTLEMEVRVSTYTQSEVSHVVHPFFSAANLAYITLTVKELHEIQVLLDVSTKKAL